MADILLAGGSHIQGKPVNIGLPECGQLGLQLCQFCIGQKHILILTIGMGAGNRFTLYTLISNI